MRKLLDGVHRFTSEIYPRHQEQFNQLAKGQSPETLFITCSDSRIDPSLITQTQPGELFVIRNAGNLVPPYRSSRGGEEPTIEYAVDALKVKNIVVCGHAHCGAMAGLQNKEAVSTLPAVASWLETAETTLRRCTGKDLPETIEQNVLVQIDNLKTHPSVSAALAEGRIQIFGWVYHFDKGEVTIFHPGRKTFLPLSELGSTQPETLAL